MLEIRPEVGSRTRTHDKSVVSVAFNRVSSQVITMAQDGTVFMWLVESGQKIKSLSQLHGPSAEVTCMEFDEAFTKIYTAANDGLVKIWDFNGYCINSLVTNEGTIRQLV